MCQGQINTGKLCGDGRSGRCGERRVGWVEVLWRESLPGTAWQNYTSLLPLHSLDFHIYLWLFFFKPWALLTWESCCVKHYWLEFLISCHYSMTIGEWNVFYFFHHSDASSVWEAAMAQAVSSRHFQLKIFAVWAKRRICPRSKPQLSVFFLELKHISYKVYFEARGFQKDGWLGDLPFFSQGCRRPFSPLFPPIFSHTLCLSTVFCLVLKKWRKLLKIWNHSIWCDHVMCIIPIRHKLQEGIYCKPEEDLDQPYLKWFSPLTCQIWTLLEFLRKGFMVGGVDALITSHPVGAVLGASSPSIFLLISSKTLGLFGLAPKISWRSHF